MAGDVVKEERNSKRKIRFKQRNGCHTVKNGLISFGVQ